MNFSVALSRGKHFAGFAALFLSGVAAYGYLSTHLIVDSFTGAKPRIFPGAVFNKELLDLKTGRTITLHHDSRPILLILLSGTECPACLDEDEVWNHLAEKHDRLRVVAVFVGTTTQDVRDYIQQRKPGYEVYRFLHPGDEGRLGAEYARPLSVLMDRWGRVKYAAGPTGNLGEHQRLAREILKFIGA